MKFTFLGFCIEAILLKALEDFLDLLAVNSFVGRVNENVIQLFNHTNIQHVGKYVVYELLKNSGSISKTFQYHQPLEGPIFGSESGFPLVTCTDWDKMVGMAEVNLGVNSCFSGSI